jgi:hypothetical protein
VTLIAHAGHWLTSIAYFVPVVVFLGWLVVTQLRDRRSRNEGVRSCIRASQARSSIPERPGCSNARPDPYLTSKDAVMSAFELLPAYTSMRPGSTTNSPLLS